MTAVRIDDETGKIVDFGPRNQLVDAVGFTILPADQWNDPSAIPNIGMEWINRPATPAVFDWPQEGSGNGGPASIAEATENLRLANENVKTAIEDLVRLQGD